MIGVARLLQEAVGEAGGVVEEVADQNVGRRTVGEFRAERRQVPGDRVVEAELALLGERQRGRGDHRLRHRGEAEDAVLAEPLAGLAVGESGGARIGGRAVDGDAKCRTDHGPSGADAAIERPVERCREARFQFVHFLQFPQILPRPACHVTAAFGVAFLPGRNTGRSGFDASWWCAFPADRGRSGLPGARR